LKVSNFFKKLISNISDFLRVYYYFLWFTQFLALLSTRNGKSIIVSEFFTLRNSLILTVRISLWVLWNSFLKVSISLNYRYLSTAANITLNGYQPKRPALRKTIKEIASVNEKISGLTTMANNGPLWTSHEQPLEKLIREEEKLESSSRDRKRLTVINNYIKLNGLKKFSDILF